LPIPDGYSFPHLDASVRPGNTALIYIDETQFRDQFVKASLSYATKNSPPAHLGLPAFLFSGQRLFTMIGARGPWSMRAFIPYVYRAYGNGEWVEPNTVWANPLDPLIFLDGWPYTHLWSFKHDLRRDETMTNLFIEQLMAYMSRVAPPIATWLKTVRI
jgi:hypothetical protein